MNSINRTVNALEIPIWIDTYREKSKIRKIYSKFLKISCLIQLYLQFYYNCNILAQFLVLCFLEPVAMAFAITMNNGYPILVNLRRRVRCNMHRYLWWRKSDTIIYNKLREPAIAMTEQPSSDIFDNLLTNKLIAPAIPIAEQPSCDGSQQFFQEGKFFPYWKYTMTFIMKQWPSHTGGIATMDM